MYFGLPIVSTNVSAIPELVKDGENGLLVSPGDASALASALNRLLTDADLCRQLAENNRRKAASGYFWEDTERRFVEIVKKLAHGRG